MLTDVIINNRQYRLSWCGSTSSAGSNGSGGTSRNRNSHGLAVQQVVVLHAIKTFYDAASCCNRCNKK